MTSITRRGVVLGGLATGAAVALPRSARGAPAHAFRNALSVSPFTELVLHGNVTFTDGKLEARTTESLQRLFMAHGASEVYARLGTRLKFTPGNADHGVERGLERARLAKQLDLPFNPELGLFASYGDITHQPEPDFSEYPSLAPTKPWHELSLAQMTDILRRYGTLTARQILDTGARVNIWDLGNEVERGVAGVAAPPIGGAPGWTYRAPDAVDPEIGRMSLSRYVQMAPLERVQWLETHLWPHMGAIFGAVAEGIRAVDPRARFTTHVSGMAAYSSEMFVGFYRAMDKAGFRCDELGLSFYPSSSQEMADRFAGFKQMVTTAATSLTRPVFVAEYAYPTGPFKFGADRWDHPTTGYAISRDGQRQLMRDLTAWGARTGHLSGLRPWAPDLVIPGWGEMSCFDLVGHTAKARPSLNAIAEGLAGART